MTNSGKGNEAGEWSNMGPHEEFLELCAVSTSGDLTEEERKRLKLHLAECPECRKALEEFEATVDVGVPLLASKLSAVPSDEPASPNTLLTNVGVPLKRAASESPHREVRISTGREKRGFAFTQRNDHERTHVNWNYVWMPFAACVLLTIALGIYAYRAGKSQNAGAAHEASVAADAQVEALEQRISDAGHEREVLRTQLIERDKVIAELRRETEQQARSLNEMKSAQVSLEQSLQADPADKQRVVDERASVAERYDAAQASLQRMQAELDSANAQQAQQRTQDASLESQIKDLSGQLRDQGQTVAKQDELLSHDRDIRELMGARDLYVAEVYDVARDGTTQKAYGRLFYTKGKSLIFYAYDLDETRGVRNASTFQAWGRRGPDREQALNLGIFYVDNAAKKRWVLKFENPKELDEIDAVFVTVEPKGGSRKPSGKPLLYAYLQLAPNHP
ncbi:MAG: zf-HC2 domain-containing protein [Candidatus Acidiferrales bacterium]